MIGKFDCVLNRNYKILLFSSTTFLLVFIPIGTTGWKSQTAMFIHVFCGSVCL